MTMQDDVNGEGPGLRLPGVRRPAGDGLRWITRGWRLFARAPLMWIISLVLLFILALLVSLVPIVGSLAFQVLQPVFAAGFMIACRSLERGGDFELEHLFAGFSRAFVPLAIVGALLLLGWLVIFGVFAMSVGMSLLGAVMGGDAEAMASAAGASLGAVLLGTLLVLALMVPLVAAYWFAPALVALNGMKPLAAMKESFFACFRNWAPYLLYGVVMLVAALIALIPLGLGMLVWVPLAITSTYVAYRDIFTRDEGVAATPPGETGAVP